MASRYRFVTICILIIGLLTFLSIFIDPYGIILGRQKISANAMNYTAYGTKKINRLVTTSMERRLPTAIIIGGMKCGTGALSKFLSLHPDAVTSFKGEVRFFDQSYEKGIDWYRAQMNPSRADQITFEKSQYFTGSFNIPRYIYKTNKNMKLILILRNPVHRTISHFAMKRELNPRFVEKCPMLRKCVTNDETGNVLVNHTFIDNSMYFKHFLKWLWYFPLKQFLILDGDLFGENPLPAMTKVEKFLGLRDYFNDSVLYYDDSKGFYCYRTEQNKKECLSKKKGRKLPQITHDLINTLSEFFKPQNERLFALINWQMNWT